MDSLPQGNPQYQLVYLDPSLPTGEYPSNQVPTKDECCIELPSPDGTTRYHFGHELFGFEGVMDNLTTFSLDKNLKKCPSTKCDGNDIWISLDLSMEEKGLTRQNCPAPNCPGHNMRVSLNVPTAAQLNQMILRSQHFYNMVAQLDQVRVKLEEGDETQLQVDMAIEGGSADSDLVPPLMVPEECIDNVGNGVKVETSEYPAILVGDSMELEQVLMPINEGEVTGRQDTGPNFLTEGTNPQEGTVSRGALVKEDSSPQPVEDDDSSEPGKEKCGNGNGLEIVSLTSDGSMKHVQLVRSDAQFQITLHNFNTEQGMGDENPGLAWKAVNSWNIDALVVCHKT